MQKPISHFLSHLPGLSCRRATRLAAKAMDVSLALGERIEWGFHHLICRTCRNYSQHLKLMRKWLRHYDDSRDEQLKLSKARAERIKARLAEENERK